MALDRETYESLLSVVRRFVEDELMPAEREVAAGDAIPMRIVEQMRELGLFGLSIPTEYGGIGLQVLEEVGVMLELGRASPAFRSLIATNVGIGSQGIVIDGTDAQKAQYLPKIADGSLIGSFALTEPETGSDAGSVRTRAVRDGDSYILNGTKRFITNAPEAGLFTVMARTDPAVSGAGGVSALPSS